MGGGNYKESLKDEQQSYVKLHLKTLLKKYPSLETKFINQQQLVLTVNGGGEFADGLIKTTIKTWMEKRLKDYFHNTASIKTHYSNTGEFQPILLYTLDILPALSVKLPLAR